MSAPPDLPGIVARAFDVSRQAGYVSFCRNETGRLLATLAATRGGILTAELDPKLAGAAQEIF